jgi:asparagine synthase (glutamine-hydrolysing)
LAIEFDIDVNVLRSDVDIILHLYEKLNYNVCKLVNLLDGDFAFVLYDTTLKRYYVSRDIIGVRPLFYSTLSNDRSPNSSTVGWVEIARSFASEVKGLKNGENVKIAPFPPGHVFEYNSEHRLSKRYNFIENYQQQKIVELLKYAVIKRIENSDRPVAFLCSGGLDSSLILCIANEYLKKYNRDLHVFSMHYIDKNGYTNSEDKFYCERLVNLLGVKYTSLTFDLKDVIENIDKIVYQTETYDPNTIRTSIANYLLAKKIKETTDYKVFLSGEGADELFCGYSYFNQIQDAEKLNKESERLVQNIHMFDILKADRCFNAFGLEVRVPFLDKDFITYVKSISGKFKAFDDGIEKNLLRLSFKLEYPTLNEARIIDRAKEKFSDGVSFNYVPDLMNYCSNYKLSVLSEKEDAEKMFYKKIFDKYYVNLDDLIIKRTLPNWCINLTEIINLVN